MNTAQKAALLFIAPVAVGKALDVFLKSESGRKLAARTGNEVLVTPEGRELAKKYTGLAATAIGGALGAKKAGELGEGLRSIKERRATDWLGIAEDTAAILLAVGALVKAVADFVREKRRAAQRAASRA